MNDEWFSCITLQLNHYKTVFFNYQFFFLTNETKHTNET